MTIVINTGMRAVLFGAGLGWCVAAGFGQPADDSGAGIATTPYVNVSFGFEMQTPAGWKYDRTGFFGAGGSLGLLRGAAPGGRATLQILIFRELDLPSFPKWIEYFSEQLGALSGSTAVRVQGAPDAGRAAAYVTAEAVIGFDRTRTVYYCVQFDDETIFVFSLAEARRQLEEAPIEPAAEEAIPADFLRLAKTLRIFYSTETAEMLAAALQRGKQYLARFQLQKDVEKLEFGEETRYYEILLEGASIGYTTRRFAREDEPLQRSGSFTNAKEGLRARELTYRFAADGAVQYSQVDLFSSRDLETDLYEMSQVGIPGVAGQEAYVTRDQCVREGEALFSTFSTSRDVVLPEPRRPIKLKSGYLGLAWVRLLPALLGPEQTEMIAFTIYDTETRTLVTHAIRSLGEKRTPGSESVMARIYEIREGFAETPSVIYTNAAGEMLRLEAGGLVLKLEDEARIEKLFGKRREEANLRLRESAIK